MDHMLQQPQTGYQPYKADEESDLSRYWWKDQYATRILVVSFTLKHVTLQKGFYLHKRWQHGHIQLGKPALRSLAQSKLVLLSNPCVWRRAFLLHRDSCMGYSLLKGSCLVANYPFTALTPLLGDAGESQPGELKQVKNSSVRRRKLPQLRDSEE